MRLRTLLVLVFAASTLTLTLIGSVAVYRFVSARAQNRVETRMTDLADQLHHLIDVNVAERLGDMQVLTTVARTTATSSEARRT